MPDDAKGKALVLVVFVHSNSKVCCNDEVDGSEILNGEIILLMVQKSGVHQLRLAVYPSIYDGFFTSQVVVWDFFHQQYPLKIDGCKLVHFLFRNGPFSVGTFVQFFGGYKNHQWVRSYQPQLNFL